MVMTASAARTASSVSRLGTAVERSIPTSRIAAATAGLTSLAGVLPGADTDPARRVVLQKGGRHLAAPGVVHADEAQLWRVVH